MALLNVPLHLQDRFDLCGPACAQMVARFRGAPLAAQSTAGIGAADPAWLTTPTQLATLLNALGPAGGPAYKVFTSSSVAGAMSHVTASLAHGLPPVVLVGDGEHWVVVRGFTGAGAKRLVHFRDPFPDRTLIPGAIIPLTPHADTDDCNEGALLAGGNGNAMGASDEVVRWNTWRRDYLTPCALGGAPWLHKRIVVAATLTATPAPQPVASPMVALSQPILEPQAIELARREIEQSELMSDAD